MTLPRCLVPSAALPLVASLLVSTAAAQAPPPAGLPNPAQLPSRPGTAGAPGMPPRDTSARPPAPKGTGVVRGRVVAADTGLPLRRVRVSMRGMRQREGRMTLSGDDGSFVLDALPADRYELRGSKARYVDTALGARKPGGQGRPFELGDGQRIDNVVLALASAGVITGKVIDDIGDTVAGATVAPMRYRTVNGTRQLMPAGRPATTDDTGTYRLFGLPPGRYFVSAKAEDVSQFMGDTTPSGLTGYAATYFPSAVSPGDAQEVEVAAGGEAAADVTLVAARLSKVSGVVVDGAGRKAKAGAVMAMTGANGAALGMGGFQMISGDGTFTLAGLAPGEYTLSIRPQFDDAPDRTALFQSAAFSMPFVANGTDVTDLRIVVPEAIELTGRVVFEGGTPGEKDRTTIMLTSPASFMDGATAEAGPDGRFTLRAMPGTRRLGVFVSPTWMIRRMTFRGREIDPDDEVEVTAEAGGRIEVVVTNRLTAVTGTVVDGSGRALTDYQVVVFPESAEAMKRGSFRRTRIERPDQQGQFRATGLPPGRYLAVAVTELDPEDAQDPEVLDGLRKSATPVQVRDAETVTLNLTMSRSSAAVP